jgi:hypothetical protein
LHASCWHSDGFFRLKQGKRASLADAKKRVNYVLKSSRPDNNEMQRAKEPPSVK